MAKKTNTICCGNIIGGDEMFIFTFLVRRRDEGRLRSAGRAPDQTSDEETKNVSLVAEC